MKRLLLLLSLPVALTAAAVPGGATPRDDGPALTLTRATTNAAWREGYLEEGAQVRFSGTVSGPAHLTAILRPTARHGTVTARLDFDVVAAGSFSKKLT